MSGTTEASHNIEEQSRAGLWLPRVLGTILVIGLIIFIGKGCNGAYQPDDNFVAESSGATDLLQPVSSRETLKVTLPDGVILDAYKGGIEDQLVTYLNNPSTIPGRNVWFDFDNLNFKLSSAEITGESMKQVLNIDAILKAYPKLKIKIGGYTDKTGDSLDNMKLSGNRATAVFNALKVNGANPGQLTGAEGYGSQYAKAEVSAPDEERLKDRRISVGVREK